MDTPRKVIVGIDLCEDYTQLCCYSYKTLEPIPISMREDDKLGLIPTVLCVKAETKQWLIGEEAIVCGQNNGGILVEHLITRLTSEEEVEILGQRFNGVALLEKYLRKVLTLLKNYFPAEPITKLVVTLKDTEPALVNKVYEALSPLGIEKDRAVIISHASAYQYYALNQEPSLWMNDVGLFEFEEEGLRYYQLRINRRVKPMIAGLSKIDYTSTLDYTMLKRKDIKPDYLFENLANEALYKQIVSTLYFVGRGFEGGWADEVIKGLCIGRRVFYGQNLFSKGACYAAKELAGDCRLKDFILLNDDMVACDVSLRVFCDTKFKELPLMQAGETWYEVDKRIEVIPEGAPELEIIIKNIMTRDSVRERILPDPLPDRPDKMTRLELHFTCKDRSSGIIRVRDLGFGEYYPATQSELEFLIEFG